MAAAHALHDGIGLPGRQVPRVLAALQGLPLTQGAITQDAMRCATGEIGERSEFAHTNDDITGYTFPTEILGEYVLFTNDPDVTGEEAGA